MSPADLVGKTIIEASLDDSFQQLLILVFSDGTKAKISGHSNHSDEWTAIEIKKGKVKK